MTTWIEFKTAESTQHPEAEVLKRSPLALLIEECLHKHDDVFGDICPVDVYLSDDGTLGELHLSPDSSRHWVPVTIVRVNLDMFHESPLPVALRQSVAKFFDDFARHHRER